MKLDRKIVGGLTAGAAALAVAGLTQFEGMSLVAKHERIDPPGVITWCIGETNHDDPTMKVGTRFTREECIKRLPRVLPRYVAQVDKCIHVHMPEHRYAAVLMFTYNLGGGTLCRSKVAYHLNRGEVQAGCDAMLPYVRAAGKVLPGLIRRRHFERAWCLRED